MPHRRLRSTVQRLAQLAELPNVGGAWEVVDNVVGAFGKGCLHACEVIRLHCAGVEYCGVRIIRACQSAGTRNEEEY